MVVGGGCRVALDTVVAVAIAIYETMIITRHNGHFLYSMLLFSGQLAEETITQGQMTT
jgi:hypothetical protein